MVLGHGDVTDFAGLGGPRVFKGGLEKNVGLNRVWVISGFMAGRVCSISRFRGHRSSLLLGSTLIRVPYYVGNTKRRTLYDLKNYPTLPPSLRTLKKALNNPTTR